MKVLIFMTQFYRLSGAERLAVELAEQLNLRGIHTDILSMYSEDFPGVLEAKINLLRKGIPEVHFLDMKIHPPIWSLLPAIYKLRHLILQNGYTIIETSMMSPTVIASLLTRFLKIHHVSGIHDIYQIDRYNSLRNKFWRITIRNDNILFYAITKCVKNHWVEYLQISPERCSVVYNSIHDDYYNTLPEKEKVRSELNISSDQKIALFVGRMLKRKGIDTILDGLGPILKKENLHLVYVGSCDQSSEGFFVNEDDLLNSMNKKIVSEGWIDRTHFLGYRSDIPRLMASADILIHPARIEGFGLTLVEALATGLPIVASNVGGIPEVLEGTDSIIVSPDDPLSLREAVIEILHRTQFEADAARIKGRVRSEFFRTKKRTDEMIKIFENVI